MELSTLFSSLCNIITAIAVAPNLFALAAAPNKRVNQTTRFLNYLGDWPDLMDPLLAAASEEVVMAATMHENAQFLKIFFHTLNIVADCKPPTVAGWSGDRGQALKLREASNISNVIANIVKGDTWRTSLTSKGWKEFTAHLCALHAMLKYGEPKDKALHLAVKAKFQNDQLQKGVWQREQMSAVCVGGNIPKLEDVPRRDVAGQVKYDRYVAFFEKHDEPLKETLGHMLLALRQAMSTDCKPNDVVALKGTLPVEPGYQTEKERMEEAREIRAKEAESDDEW